MIAGISDVPETGFNIAETPVRFADRGAGKPLPSSLG
jgi:hypothetical protein